MCKKLAIFPVLSVFLTILSPKQAFAAKPAVIDNQKLVFSLKTDTILKNGFIKGEDKPEIAIKVASNEKPSEEITEDIRKKISKETNKTFTCSEDDLVLGKCKTFKVLATGYSSTVDQCDADPFITASNKHVHRGILACNFLPFGTLVKFPEHFGDRVFIVEDRMAKRFSDRMDVWFETRSEALRFGARKLTAVVITK